MPQIVQKIVASAPFATGSAHPLTRVAPFEQPLEKLHVPREKTAFGERALRIDPSRFPWESRDERLQLFCIDTRIGGGTSKGDRGTYSAVHWTPPPPPSFDAIDEILLERGPPCQAIVVCFKVLAKDPFYLFPAYLVRVLWKIFPASLDAWMCAACEVFEIQGNGIFGRLVYEFWLLKLSLIIHGAQSTSVRKYYKISWLGFANGMPWEMIFIYSIY